MVVDLVDSLLQHLDHGVKGAQTVGVFRAAGVRARDRNNGVIAEEVSKNGHGGEKKRLTQ